MSESIINQKQPSTIQEIANYSFDKRDKTVTYTIKTQTDQNIVSIEFVAKPFVKRK